jgi:hypothetical protein
VIEFAGTLLAALGPGALARHFGTDGLLPAYATPGSATAPTPQSEPDPNVPSDPAAFSVKREGPKKEKMKNGQKGSPPPPPAENAGDADQAAVSDPREVRPPDNLQVEVAAEAAPPATTKVKTNAKTNAKRPAEAANAKAASAKKAKNATKATLSYGLGQYEGEGKYFYVGIQDQVGTKKSPAVVNFGDGSQGIDRGPNKIKKTKETIEYDE